MTQAIRIHDRASLLPQKTLPLLLLSMEFTEREMKYLEDASIDNAMLYKEIKAMREELAEIKTNTSDERMTKKSILAIKDRHKRLKAIEENIPSFF